MRVRLTRKFSDLINGIDLSKANAGETLDLPAHDAEILMAEGWAEIEGAAAPRAVADDKPHRKRATRRSKSSKA